MLIGFTIYINFEVKSLRFGHYVIYLGYDYIEKIGKNGEWKVRIWLIIQIVLRFYLVNIYILLKRMEVYEYL